MILNPSGLFFFLPLYIGVCPQFWILASLSWQATEYGTNICWRTLPIITFSKRKSNPLDWVFFLFQTGTYWGFEHHLFSEEKVGISYPQQIICKCNNSMQMFILKKFTLGCNWRCKRIYRSEQRRFVNYWSIGNSRCLFSKWSLHVL